MKLLKTSFDSCPLLAFERRYKSDQLNFKKLVDDVLSESNEELPGCWMITSPYVGGVSMYYDKQLIEKATKKALMQGPGTIVFKYGYSNEFLQKLEDEGVDDEVHCRELSKITQVGSSSSIESYTTTSDPFWSFS